MKHISIVFLCSLLFIQNIQAQKIKNEDLDFLKNQKEFHLVFDWSKAIIDGKIEEDFVNIKAITSGEEWKNKWDTTIKKEFELKFKAAFNGKLFEYDLKAGDYPNATYKATVNIQRIDRDGEIYAFVIFSNISTNEQLITMKINGDGGNFGTIENLFGDGFEKAGIALAKKVVKSFE